LVDERFEPAIEVAAYHVVADVIRGGLGPLRIGARRGGERLTVEVAASRIPERIVLEVADRVGAANGSLKTVRDGDRAVTLIAEFLCAS
jgi:hypothetical protein